MSGLAATRLVKRHPTPRAAAKKEDKKESEIPLNGPRFLDQKTDHAAYLYNTIFSIVAIALSQLATIRPQAPFVWLGIYLLRHSGLCSSVTLHDGRVIICDDRSQEPPSSRSDASSNFSNKSADDNHEEVSDQEDHSWDGELSSTSEELQAAADALSGSDDDGLEFEKAVTILQSNFRRKQAKKIAAARRKKRRNQHIDDESSDSSQSSPSSSSSQSAHSSTLEVARAPSQIRRYRHGVRMGRTLFHVMASSDGELLITDSRTLAKTRAKCPPESAHDLAAVTQCVREVMDPEKHKREKLLTGAVCVRPLDVSAPIPGQSGMHGMVFLHFQSPTAIFLDSKSGRAYISCNSPHLSNRDQLSKAPDETLSQMWLQEFGGDSQNYRSGGPRLLVRQTTKVGEVESYFNQIEGVNEQIQTQSPESKASVEVAYILERTSSVVPPAVKTNNFVQRKKSPKTATPRTPMMLPRVIKTAHRFPNGCRVMVEINHRVDPVKIVVFEQRSMTSETFLAPRSSFQNSIAEDGDRGWISAIVKRLQCNGSRPNWQFSFE